MGRVTKIKDNPSFLDNLKSVADVVSKGAQAYSEIKAVGQRDTKIQQDQQVIDQNKIKMEQDREFSLKQMESIDSQMKAREQEYQINQVKLQEVGRDQLSSLLFEAANKPDPKAFWENNAQRVLQTHALIGSNTTPEQAQMDFTKNLANIKEPLTAIQLNGDILTKSLYGPDKFVDVKKMGEQIAQYSKAVDSMASSVSPATAKIFRDKEEAFKKRISEIEKQKQDQAQLALDTQKAEDISGRGTSKLAKSLYDATQKGPLAKLNELQATANTLGTSMDAFAKDPNGYSDYGLLMQSLKSLQGDQSVVRETELSLGKNATSLINKAKNSLQQALDGRSLQPEQRDQILSVMRVMQDSYGKAYEKAAAPIRAQAQASGVDLNLVFPQGVGGNPAKVEQAASGTAPPAPAVSAQDFIKARLNRGKK